MASFLPYKTVKVKVRGLVCQKRDIARLRYCCESWDVASTIIICVKSSSDMLSQVSAMHDSSQVKQISMPAS